MRTEGQMTKKLRTVKVPDYGDEELNRLADAMLALDRMDVEQRHRALKYFKSRYTKEWPSDSYQ
jgi:hypothetical protein